MILSPKQALKPRGPPGTPEEISASPVHRFCLGLLTQQAVHSDNQSSIIICHYYTYIYVYQCQCIIWNLVFTIQLYRDMIGIRYNTGVWRCKLILWYFAWPRCLQVLLVVFLRSMFTYITPSTLRIVRHGVCARTAPTRRPVFSHPYDSSFLSLFKGTEQRSKQYWRVVWEG